MTLMTTRQSPDPRRTPGRLALALAAIMLVAATATACSSNQKPADDASGPTTTSPEAAADPGTSGTSPVSNGIRIEVLSSQPDRVTGSDARVRVSPARDGSVADLRVDLGGHDVTAQLQERNGALEGVIVGFVEGTNTLVARAGSQTATQRIRSWPIPGPMISGPHLPLLACSTEASGLGKPTDADCSAPTRVRWRYISTAGDIKDLADPTARPGDIATGAITTPSGKRTVPLIVRYEQGVVNRSVYEIASIDPTPRDDSDLGDAAWNKKLIYRYGGGCGSTFGQGTAQATAADPAYLKQGYALATASFNTFAVQCNDVLSAETTMMVKERFIEEFGQPAFTLGEGRSGGSMQIHLIAQNYPGLLDGAVALQPFPDLVTVMGGMTDCGLLNRWYATPAGIALSPAQRTAINGHATAATCTAWEQAFRGLLEPSIGCDPAIPKAQIYDPTSNPTGLRCTLWDTNINQFGRNDETGFAERPLDNVGIQYGLNALNEGTISFDQFLSLNKAVGGYDLDGQYQPARENADPEVVARAYETGRVSTGVGDQRKIPIIEVNVFTDPTGDIHDRFRAFSLRDRLTEGQSPTVAPGFQIWTREPSSAIDAAAAVNQAGIDATRVLDRWLTAIDDKPARGSRADTLERTRPGVAVDNCLPPGSPKPIIGLHIYDDPGPCQDRYPLYGDPRTAAGAPRQNDVIKCTLKAIDPLDYEQSITTDQFDQLNEVFPEGVCDWVEAGVGQTAPTMTDRTYDDTVTPEQLA